MSLKEKKGVLICLLSPDGGGKTSTLTLLGNFANYNMVYMHWRPGLLPQLSDLFFRSKIITTNIPLHSSHVQKKRRIPSFIRWVYYLVDFTLGYYLKLLPLKIKSTIITIDRYYYDVIIDPLRYGFNLPQWMLKSVIPVIPKPDITIYLDNTPEVLYERKKELSFSELERQVNAWREFIPSLPNPRIVTTDKPIEDVVSEITGLILQKRAEMARNMLKIDPEESFYLWQSELAGGYVALPSKKNCRWIIPLRRNISKKSLELYHPYTLKGKLSKKFFKVIAGSNILKYLKSLKLSLEITDEKQALKRCLEEVFKREDIVLAVSTGTPGPFRKVTAMVMDSDGRALGYVKIAKSQNAIRRLENEGTMLKAIKNMILSDGDTLTIPECLYEGRVGDSYLLITTPVPFKGNSGEAHFDERYAEILKSLIKNTIKRRKFIDSDFYRLLKSGTESYILSFRELLSNALKHIEHSIGEKETFFSLSHGDFAPWNILWDGNKAFLYDWESARTDTPAGIDLMHFLFQTGFLLKKLRGDSLLGFCLDERTYRMLEDLKETPMLQKKLLLLTYLLFMAVEEDKEQILSPPAVERRRIIQLIINP